MCHPTSDSEIHVPIHQRRSRFERRIFSSLYGIWTEIGKLPRDYEFSDVILEYTIGVRPQRGRDWSKCTKFYILVNVRGKNHQILAVVELLTWRIVVYNSILWVTGSKKELEQHMMPYTTIFPLLLQKTGKFESYKDKFSRDMKLASASRSIVPINAQT